MTRVTCHVALSLDGRIAGPDQSLENGLGVGGRALMQWQGSSEQADVDARAEILGPMGAFVMGRNMFGPGRGAWDAGWRGWWGETPPYGGPVFVLTHHPREPLELLGGTTFHFVTDGFDAALARAKDAAGERAVRITGGAATVRQALAAGAIDDIYLSISPVALGSGEPLFDAPVTLTQLEVTSSSVATHVRYRVERG